jgi:tetratricopeptide (TPR) repeat protein
MRWCWFIVSIFILCDCSVLHKERDYNLHDSSARSKNPIFDYTFTEALKQKMLGNYEQARNLFDKCIEMEPGTSGPYYELSLIYDLLNDRPKAVYNAKMAVKHNKANEWYLLHCAKLYKDGGNLDSVLYFFQKLVQVRPDRYDYGYKLSQLYSERNQFKKSVSLLQELERKFGPTKEIYISEYRCYLALKDQKKGLVVLNSALKSFPDEVRFYGLLAEHFASIGEKDKALAYYNQLLSFDPANERGYLSMIDFYRNYGQLMESFLLSNRFVCNDTFSASPKIELISSYLNDKRSLVENKKEIKALIDSFVNRYNDNLQGRSLLADFFLLDNDLKSSRDELLYLLTKSKSNVLIWEKLLYVLSMMNDTKAIYEFTSEAILTFANNPLFYLYKGTSAFQLKRYDEAISVLNRGLNFSKGSKDLLTKYYATLGEAYHVVNDNDKSDYCFEKAIQLGPSNVVVLNNYSYYLSLRKVKLNIALKCIQRCVKIEPLNPTFLDTYAWILFNTGKSNEAKLEIEKALKYGGANNVTILEHYCEILINLNLRSEAVNCYNKIEKYGRDVSRIKEKLNLLKN